MGWYTLSDLHQWGRRLERWSNTEVRLAGWQRFVLWWTVHAAFPDGPYRTACPGLKLFSCELLAYSAWYSAAVADVISLMYTKHRHELYHAKRKAWVKTLGRPCRLSGSVVQGFPYRKYIKLNKEKILEYKSTEFAFQLIICTQQRAFHKYFANSLPIKLQSNAREHQV
jgi:hypothetical protein